MCIYFVVLHALGYACINADQYVENNIVNMESDSSSGLDFGDVPPVAAPVSAAAAVALPATSPARHAVRLKVARASRKEWGLRAIGKHCSLAKAARMRERKAAPIFGFAGVTGMLALPYLHLSFTLSHP